MMTDEEGLIKICKLEPGRIIAMLTHYLLFERKGDNQ